MNTFEGVCRPAVIVLDGSGVAYSIDDIERQIRLHRTIEGEVEREREFLWGLGVFFGPYVVKST